MKAGRSWGGLLALVAYQRIKQAFDEAGIRFAQSTPCRS